MFKIGNIEIVEDGESVKVPLQMMDEADGKERDPVLDAHAEYDRQLTSAWKNGVPRQAEPLQSKDATETAYQRYDDRVANAWRVGKSNAA